MAVGAGALMAYNSYITVGRETTLGTYTTATAALEPLSIGLKTTQERKTLEEINRFRTYSKGVSLGKSIAGNIETYMYCNNTACAYMVQAAMGSTVTSATLAAGAIQHSFDVGSMSDTYKSLCLNVRKGDSSGAKVFQYSGVRVNEMTVSGEIDDPLKISFGLIGIDSTLTTNDVSSVIFPDSNSPLNFTGGRFSVESTFASLTSSSFWHVQSVEFSLSNNLKADNDSRRIGSNLLQVLPPGIATMELKATIRFDTSTAYDAMLAASQFSGELVFQGSSLTAAYNETFKLEFPKLFIVDSGDPEIGGPDEILTSEVTFQVLRDVTSATGYAVKATIINNAGSL